MSELLLYIVATAVVLAGVAYFFVKQREQEALERRNSNKQQGRGKKEPKAPKEPKERKPREEKPKAAAKPAAKKEAKKEQPAPVAAASSKKKKVKDEDETKGVLDFLKGKKFSTDKSEKTAQAKVKTAPAQTQQKAPKPTRIEYSDSESGSEDEGYDLIKRKVKATKDKAEEAAGAAVDAVTGENQPQKKKKFFTKAEEAEYKAKREAAKAEREARKNRPPGEKRERRKKPEGEDDGEFSSPKERRPRRERAPRAEGEEGEDDGERRRKFPPREPDAAPVFAAEYETADMDNLLNSLTSYYNAHPQAGRSKKSKPAKQETEGKAEEEADE